MNDRDYLINKIDAATDEEINELVLLFKEYEIKKKERYDDA
ncbi:hypothetical protein ACDZ28_13475 [Paenibacillus sp. RS8]